MFTYTVWFHGVMTNHLYLAVILISKKTSVAGQPWNWSIVSFVKEMCLQKSVVTVEHIQHVTVVHLRLMLSQLKESKRLENIWRSVVFIPINTLKCHFQNLAEVHHGGYIWHHDQLVENLAFGYGR